VHGRARDDRGNHRITDAIGHATSHGTAVHVHVAAVAAFPGGSRQCPRPGSSGATRKTDRSRSHRVILLLLAKDLRRARHNPLPWVINLLVPLLVVALIGLTFGGGRKEQGIGRIRFALVDEDGTRLMQILRGGLNQEDGPKYLDPVFLERTPALALLEENKLSAVVILPRGFTSDYLAGRSTRLELIKNPAQSINPALLEEMLGVLVSGLDALARNFAPDLAAWQDVITGKGNYHRVAELIERSGDKFKSLRTFIDPPLVGYVKTQKAKEAQAPGGMRFNLFGYLLIGMSAMFLLFLAGIGMSDLHREVQLRTMDRFRTMHDSLVAFVGAKVIFNIVMLLGCAAVLFGGGALVFGVAWPRPGPLLVLIVAYVVFATGLMALLVAAVPEQRKAEGLRSLVSMGLAIAGGCAFPPDQFPVFMRERILPLLPTHWFVGAARSIEFGAGQMSWPLAAAELTIAGAICLALSAWFFRRELLKGGRT
jgi:ABC-2 type transport system permease protein